MRTPTSFPMLACALACVLAGSAASAQQQASQAAPTPQAVAPAVPAPPAAAPSVWQPQASGTTAELRGLSVVSPTVAWASGAKGTVLRTVDGVSWKLLPVPDAAALDFRDIHAFDEKSAIIMSAGPGTASRLYRTDDGGATWKLLATNTDPKGFWDAMAFWDANKGILFGDPVDGRFQVLVTADGGKTWQPSTDAAGLAAVKDEGAFAASGTCLSVDGADDAWFVTGGAQGSRVFHSTDKGKTWKASPLPILAGAPSRGGFSVAFREGRIGLAAGGDYKEPTKASLNGARSEDGGATWAPAPILPAGYMSVVVPVPGAPHAFVAAGLAGSGVSTDDGKTWTVLDRTPVNSAAFSTPSGGWLVGPKGVVLKYVGPALGRPQP
ncbi:glycosyl hydrolase [Massilia arenosa]|uniref:Glycosyl hydrolase n=1 Tax=Zemynaea arenosa TaxID=2561931 RepID=A0A4Y9RV60_9BURK|nr:glycosyl hydrolase [Massilia arenosa]TFW11695.1 glycosyl hydrolase [Massilia arenosa]